MQTETNDLNKDRKKQPETQHSKSLTSLLSGSWLHAWTDKKSYFSPVLLVTNSDTDIIEDFKIKPTMKEMLTRLLL